MRGVCFEAVSALRDTSCAHSSERVVQTSQPTLNQGRFHRGLTVVHKPLVTGPLPSTPLERPAVTCLKASSAAARASPRVRTDCAVPKVLPCSAPRSVAAVSPPGRTVSAGCWCAQRVQACASEKWLATDAVVLGRSRLPSMLQQSKIKRHKGRHDPADCQLFHCVTAADGRLSPAWHGHAPLTHFRQLWS